ncbi:hypothetical protein HOE31_02695 [bacterium]|jgi:hypothetical protein|nr:hypothetical protein [bacterium]MBT4121834.1 hypothetical protein [bacterium]MBT4335242.1 hypothetical protein [bacterium]MBT4495479.1 hypothetical protein [bacterium]MBT4763524.1 hypothetical protein [bacterium]
MMSKKNIIIISLIVIVVIGLAIAVLLMDDSFFDEPEVISFDQDIVIDDTSVPEVIVEPEVIINLTPIEVTVTTVANNFAERFASYSSDSGFLNLEEVKLLSTNLLKVKLNEMIEDSEGSDEFYGISSKVLKTDINALDEENGNANIIITLQREETIGSEISVIYQDLELNLVEAGNSWLVNDFEWLE